MSTLVIFDGFNAVWRLAHTMPELTTPKGQPIQLVYGFLRLVRSCLHELDADDAIVCWEEGRSKLRKRLDPWYKSNRGDGDPQKEAQRGVVNSQADLLKKVLSRMAVAQTGNGDQELEADDYIAACCLLDYERKVIVSTDHDYFQLVNESTEVYCPSFRPLKNIVYTEKNFFSLLRLTPRRFLEARLLEGDKTDFIAGINGVGPVISKQLVLAIEGNPVDIIFSPKHMKTLRESCGVRIGKIFKDLDPKYLSERIALNRKLMDLTLYRQRCFPAVQQALADVTPADGMVIFRTFRELQFQSLMDNFPTWVRPFLALGKTR